MRVLLLYKRPERPVLEMVADHLARAGFEVVLDVSSLPAESIVGAARREIDLADRVVIAWTFDTARWGTLHELAEIAARQAKLIVLCLDASKVPLDVRVMRLPLMRWDGREHQQEFGALLEALRKPLDAVEFVGGELFQSVDPVETPHPSEGREQSGIAPPSAPYVADLNAPAISTRRLLNELDKVSPPDLQRAVAKDDENHSDAAPPEDMLFSYGSRAYKSAFNIGRASPADATAFAPRKFRRATPELVRVVIHQPGDLRIVERQAREADRRAAKVSQRMGLGLIEHQAKVSVSLEVSGATNLGSQQSAAWLGEPVEFSFAVEADAVVRQVVVVVRILINDAQIGSIAFTRPVAGRAVTSLKNEGIRLKRHKRVFLSYASQDRETVSTIAMAYYHAGVRIFWDRKSLASGEEWPRRLRNELDACDLFHLCWSKSAAASEWVERETMHAISRRRRSMRRKPTITMRRKPTITVQMLDGPPWAPHSNSLDTINFDDFVRAAVVGYARGAE